MHLKAFTFKFVYLLAVPLTICYSINTLAQSPVTSPREISNVFACRDITAADLRLACYDKAVGRLEIAQKSGDIVAIGKKDLEKIERESFGFNIPSLPKFNKLFGGLKDTTSGIGKKAFKSKGIENANANVILEINRTKEFGYNRTRFYFKNGQVWEQIDSKKVRVSKKKPGNAHIRKAALGSYLLRVNGHGSAIRVRRVR